MSHIIKLINENNNKSYTNLEAVETLINYIYDICNSNFDSARPGHAIGEFNGCIPFIGPEYMSHDPDKVFEQFKLNAMVYGNYDKRDLVKHRIISFHKYDYILPKDAYNLGVLVSNTIYCNYLSAFGVHLNTENIHIHIVLSAYDIWTGKRFDFPFEYNRLDRIVHDWYNTHLDTLESVSGLKEQYEKYLFPEEATIKPVFGPGIVKRYQK